MAGLAAQEGHRHWVKSFQVAGPGGMGWSSWGDQDEAGSGRCSLAVPEPHFENQSAAIVDR